MHSCAILTTFQRNAPVQHMVSSVFTNKQLMRDKQWDTANVTGIPKMESPFYSPSKPRVPALKLLQIFRNYTFGKCSFISTIQLHNKILSLEQNTT